MVHLMRCAMRKRSSTPHTLLISHSVSLTAMALRRSVNGVVWFEYSPTNSQGTVCGVCGRTVIKRLNHKTDIEDEAERRREHSVRCCLEGKTELFATIQVEGENVEL